MATDIQQQSTALDTQRVNWRLLAGAGALISVLGLVAILAPFLTGIGLSLLLGTLLVIGGLGHIAHAFRAAGWTGSLWQVVLALLYAGTGIVTLTNPVLGLVTLTLLLVVYFAMEGAVEVVMGLRLRPESQWAWFVGSGVLSFVLAGLLWVGFPSTAVWAVGLLFGINLLSTGITLIAVALSDREPVTASTEERSTGEPETG